MRLAIGSFAALAVVGLSAPAYAQTGKNAPVVLEPSAQWSAEFGENKCRLARTFGRADNRHALYLEMGGPSANFSFVAVGPSFDRFRRPSRISLQFGEGKVIEDRSPLLGETEGWGASLIYSGVGFNDVDRSANGTNPSDEGGTMPMLIPHLNAETASKINSITLRYGKRAVIFDTGNLAAPVKVLNECIFDIIEFWGFDRAAHESMSRRPEWKNGLAVTRRVQASYPEKSLRKGEQGVFRMRVTVEADGSVSECFLNDATINESLKSPACKEMKRAIFEPALDKDGQPMRTFYTSNITYKIKPNRKI